ncbi:D-aminoacyl-tRNA deacylase [Anaerotardibacter muris]|uniref:D-aminoacyl-tRNA deacylase n=1 Tax=Anaerotardibacter muris TaxID=2941505 RepID=UPI0020412E70|nr:D-aminoacyl-tRNA deacylase [Anaerotardibacter muris]
MRAIIQRVTQASVVNLDDVASEPASIEQGYMILLGVGHEDTEAQADKLWSKISKLRIFEDDNGKTNLSLRDVDGSVLVVSQFTLYASCKKGNRPSFTEAGSPDQADHLYRYFVDLIRQEGIPVKHGWFGAHMQVSLVNDGPFTLFLDTTQM